MSNSVSKTKTLGDFEWTIGPSGFLEPKTKSFRFFGLSAFIHLVLAALFFVASTALQLDERGLSDGTVEVELLGEASPAELSPELTSEVSAETAASFKTTPSAEKVSLAKSSEPADPVITPNKFEDKLEDKLTVAPIVAIQESVSSLGPEDLERDIDGNLQELKERQKDTELLSEKSNQDQQETVTEQDSAPQEESASPVVQKENEAGNFDKNSTEKMAPAQLQSENLVSQKKTAPVVGTKTNSTAATPNGTESADPRGAVRSLGDLRQLPGNPRPQYSYQERMNRIEGEVIFHAFVTSDGTLKDFRLLKSSGSRSLDGKTLGALKKWRFYPNQSGWVKIPFVWTLKGEVESADGLLKTSDRTGGKWENSVYETQEKELLRWRETSGGLREAEAGTWE